MQPFTYERVDTTTAAIAAFGQATPASASASQYLAGGTTLIDLMKLDVMRPQTLVDINALDRQALIALDGTVELTGPNGNRTIAFGTLHRTPAGNPEIETVLLPGEIITGFAIPAAPWLRRSLYLKIRDRQSYEFALASAAIALDMGENQIVQEVRIALGGVASVPWRARSAERALQGRQLNEQTARAAA